MRFAVRQLKMVGDFWLHLIHVKSSYCVPGAVLSFFFFFCFILATNLVSGYFKKIFWLRWFFKLLQAGFL